MDVKGLILGEIAARAVCRAEAETKRIKPKQVDQYIEENWREVHTRVEANYLKWLARSVNATAA